MKDLMNLTPAALNWLGLAFEKKTKVSPLSNAQGDGLTPAGLKELTEQGIITADQMITTEAYALLDILAKATKYASVRLAGSSGQVNRITYWDGDKSVSLDNKGTSFTVTPGNDAAALEVIFNELTGANHITSSDFSGTFDFRSALVFSGLFDLSRRASLRLYADSTAVPDGFSAAEIGKFIAGADNSRWLTSHIKTLNISGLKVSPAETEASLKALAQVKVIAVAPGNLYALAYASAELAARFLVTDNVIHFRCGVEKNGKVEAAECMFLQAGIHDVVMVDIAADKMDISALSSFAMVDNIKRMMTTPPSF